MANRLPSGSKLPSEYTRRQLNAAYRAVPLADPISRLLRRYCNAMANLYGVITVEDAFEIISGQNADTISRKQFHSFIEIAVHEFEDFCISKPEEIYVDEPKSKVGAWYILDTNIAAGNACSIDSILRSHQGLEAFVPKKTALLKYDNILFSADRPETDQLKNFLRNEMHLDDERAGDVFDNLLFSVRCLEPSISNVASYLSSQGLRFDSEQDAEKFASIFVSFAETERRQAFYGHTAVEVGNKAYKNDLCWNKISIFSLVRSHQT